jgi:PTH2 family peptidyl-tRNA hydrolase
MSKKKEKKNQMEDEDYVMYVLVNTDLKMSGGKLAAQCCHSVCKAIRVLEKQQPKDKVYSEWLRNGEATVVLRSSEKEMIEIIREYEVDERINRNSSDLWCVHTRDAGRTQIAPDSLTTLVFRPIPKSEMPIKNLKM